MTPSSFIRALHLPALLRASLLPSLLFCSVFPTLAGFIIQPANVDWISLKILLSWTVALGLLAIPWRNKVILGLICVVVIALNAAEMAHWLVLESPLTTASLYVLFESNVEESKSFFRAYFSVGKTFVALAFLLSAVALCVKNIQLKREAEPLGRRGWIVAGVALVGFSSLFAYKYHQHKSGHYAYPTVVYATLAYYQNISDYREMLKTRSTVAPPKATCKGSDPQVAHILVMGESVGRGHMSLYGYKRPTSAYLEAIRDDLLVYQDVVSSHAFTRGAIEHAFTLASVDNEIDGMSAPSLMEIAKGGGYKTWWISNQIPVGLWDNKVTAIGSTAQTMQFVNISGDSKRALDTDSYDEKLLTPLALALRDPAPKKLIVLHLMGAHTTYEHRYPKAFEKFEGEGVRDRVTARYDNAVLYSDFVVSKVIEAARALKIPATVTYLSDHGEEVFEHREYHGHAWHKLSRHMVEIPFVLWVNLAWKQGHSQAYEFARANTNRPYMADDLIHSMLDLMEVEAAGVEPSRSIFSPELRARTRWIQGEWDYDMQVRPWPSALEAPEDVRAGKRQRSHEDPL